MCIRDRVKLFNETVEQTANAPALERCPLTLQAGKAPAASYYNPAAGVASFYNAKFIAALTPCLLYTSFKSARVSILLPI